MKKIYKMMMRFYLVMVLGLAGCGEGDNQTQPTIANLQNTPDSTSLVVKPLIIFDWKFDFTDLGGDLRTYTCTVLNSNGDTIYKKTKSLIIPAGQTTGTLSGKTDVVIFSSVGTYTVNIFATDNVGMNSNTLTTAFTVLP
jgi:hypothetical protein